MRNKKAIFAILACALCSCQAPMVEASSEASISSKTRVYEAFGSYTAKQVEEICKTFSERLKGYYSPENCYLKYDFGTYGNMHVNALRAIDPETRDYCMTKPESVAGYHICDFPYPSYHINVWIEGEGSFDLEDLYLQKKITDENIGSIMAKAEELGIREHKTFNTKLEDFSFSLTWDYGVVTYDSENELITVKGKTNTYTASFLYPNLDTLYEKTKALDIYSYPVEFYPFLEYGGGRMYQTPVLSYTLKIGDKKIIGNECVDCRALRNLPENLVPQGKKYLDFVLEIIDTVENSDEYKTIEVPEDDRMIFY